MRYLLTLMVLPVLLATAGAQPAPAPGPGAPVTPEQQHQVRRPPKIDPCEFYHRNDAGIPATMRANRLCTNHEGVVGLIRKVQCVTDQGHLVVRPRLTGGTDTSILAAPLVCTPAWAVGVLNGQPRLHSFAVNTTDCLGGSCSIDVVVEGVEGYPTELTVTIVREYE